MKCGEAALVLVESEKKMFKFKGIELQNFSITKHEKSMYIKYADDDAANILLVQGTPYERGFAHGVLAADEIAELYATILVTVCSAAGGFSPDGKTAPTDKQINNGKAQIKKTIKAYFTPTIKEEIPEFFDEIKGLVEGIQTKYPEITYDDVMLMNTVPESLESPKGCSNFAAWGNATKTGELIHAINLDYFSFGITHKAMTVTIVKPDEGNAYMSMGLVGTILPFSFINEAGLSYGEMTTTSTERSWPQIPHYVQSKMFAIKSSNLEVAFEIAKRTGGTTGFVNILGQVEPELKASAFETAGAITKRRDAGEDNLKKSDLIYTTNFYNAYTEPNEPESLIKGQAEYILESKKMLDMEFDSTKFAFENIDTREKWISAMNCPRFELYEKELSRLYGEIDVDSAIELQSSFPLCRAGENLPPKNKICENYEMPYGLPNKTLEDRYLASVYSLVIENEKRIMHVAVGKEPAQSGRFLTISLNDGLEMLKNI